MNPFVKKVADASNEVLACHFMRKYVEGDDCQKRDNITTISCDECQSIFTQEFEKDLDKYYLPRPLFEDGEVVQSGDKFTSVWETHEVIFILVKQSGDFEIVDEHGDRHLFLRSNRLRRPAKKNVEENDIQPSIDLEGSPIKKGDIVYNKETGMECTVQEVRQDDLFVKCTYEDDGIEYVIWLFVEDLTHTKPAIGADGRPIKIGENVYDLKTCNRHLVKDIYHEGKHNNVWLVLDGVSSGMGPARYTHTPPAFDAEGVLIRKGDTVYAIEDGEKYIVDSIPDVDKIIYRLLDPDGCRIDPDGDDEYKCNYSGNFVLDKEALNTMCDPSDIPDTVRINGVLYERRNS